MSGGKFPLDELVDSAEPPENIDYRGPDVINPETIRCAVCGTSASETNLPAGYANPVCNACDQLAVNGDGEVPWHGWPPGEEPDTDPGEIKLAPDTGENPVYIAGVKCWRRYRFGGWITRRDAFDCESLEEFQQRHRDERTVIYAFNTRQPSGVEIPREQCQETVAHYDTLESLQDDAERIASGDQAAATVDQLSTRVSTAGLTLLDSVPEPTENPTEYAEAVRSAVEQEQRNGFDFAGLCKRYYDTF